MKKLGLRNKIPVFRCIAVHGQKHIVARYIFSIPVNKFNWLGSEFYYYRLGIPKFWFHSKMNVAFVIVPNTKRKAGVLILWLSKSFPKAKTCWNADILNKEFEVGPAVVVIIPPCRITILVKHLFHMVKV